MLHNNKKLSWKRSSIVGRSSICPTVSLTLLSYGKPSELSHNEMCFWTTKQAKLNSQTTLPLQAMCVFVQYKLLRSSSSLVCLLEICSSVFHEGPRRPCRTLIWPRPRQTHCFPTAYLVFSCPFSQTGENLRKLNSSDFGRGYFRLCILFHVLPA